MNLSPDDYQLVLEGLWVLSVTRLEDSAEERVELQALAGRLGGDLDATYFRPSWGFQERVAGQ